MKSMTRAIAAAAAAALALSLAACSTGSDDSTEKTTPAAENTAFPVTITHAFGDTVIDEEPQKVVTWGWGAADAVLALGVVPAAIPAQPYGGDEEGILPWIGDKLADMGAETPVILTAGDEAPIEEIAAVEPDVVIAPYSGLTQEEYDLLSAFTKVVAYPDQPWATPWRDVVTVTGQALGKTAEAEQVLTDIDETIAAKATEHPEFDGLSIAQVWDVAGTLYVYLPADPRVEFSEDLGFVSAESVNELDTGESTFFFTLSNELLDQLEADVLLVYGDTQENVDAFLDSDAAKLLPQKDGGMIAEVIGAAEVASVSPPTALSLTWGIDSYVTQLSEAVAAAK
ncbi:ABC transporter substrate-binding protein [Jonesia quinghaiensis]|uniref:ABC transporter substrate-binding protein n=1 Tax=Jonesia quinghaiensis TaxID=262806 RepID=UPI0003F9FE2F|nr:ABC transporter substrate-binding protein [Jonesia quinghaiensis]